MAEENKEEHFLTEEEVKELGLSKRFPRHIRVEENPDYRANPIVKNFDELHLSDDDIFSLGD